MSLLKDDKPRWDLSEDKSGAPRSSRRSGVMLDVEVTFSFAKDSSIGLAQADTIEPVWLT